MEINEYFIFHRIFQNIMVLFYYIRFVTLKKIDFYTFYSQFIQFCKFFPSSFLNMHGIP